jgi:hypothetical protein
MNAGVAYRLREFAEIAKAERTRGPVFDLHPMPAALLRLLLRLRRRPRLQTGSITVSVYVYDLDAGRMRRPGEMLVHHLELLTPRNIGQHTGLFLHGIVEFLHLGIRQVASFLIRHRHDCGSSRAQIC